MCVFFLVTFPRQPSLTLYLSPLCTHRGSRGTPRWCPCGPVDGSSCCQYTFLVYSWKYDSYTHHIARTSEPTGDIMLEVITL